MSKPSPYRPLSTSRPNRTTRVLSVAAIGALAAVGLTGCGPGRSVEAYCGVMLEHKDRFVTATQDVGSADPLTGLATLVSAYGDLNSMWEEAAKVAPEDIQTDVETVRDAWASQKETAEKMMDNPLSGIASGLMTGLTSAAATQRVDEYTAAQCPDVGGMFLAGGGKGAGTDAGTDAGTGGAPGTETGTGTGGLGTDVGATEAPPEDPVPSPDHQWYAYGPVWAADASEGILEGPATFFVPTVGEVEVRAEELLGSEEVVGERYFHFPEGDEPRVAALITERVPSSGLNPEGYVTSVVSVDLGSGVAEVADRIDGEPVPEEPSVDLVGTAGASTVVVQTSHWTSGEDTDTRDGGDDYEITAYDLATGEQAWHRPAANLLRSAATGSGWVTSPTWDTLGGCADRPYNEDGTFRPVTYEWVDLSTGTTSFTMPLMVDGEDGVVCRDILDALSPRFSLVERWNTDEYVGEGLYVLDHQLQETFLVPGPIAGADPVGTAGYMDFGQYVGEDGEPTDLVVVDLSSGKELYRMEEARAAALDLQVDAIFDGILYLTTTDETVAVDVATGEELGAWSAYPQSRAGDFTLLSDGTVEQDWSFTAG